MTDRGGPRQSGPRAERRRCARVAAECVGVALRRASRVITQVFDEALRPSGLRGTQFTVLVAAVLAEPPTMTRIAQALAMDQTTLTRSLRPLERAGLVAMATGEDRRERLVALTARGSDRLASALALWKQTHARLVRRAGAARWPDILETLSTVQALGRDS